MYTNTPSCVAVQVDTVLLNTEVTFPNTAGSAIASAAAASLKDTLSSNPRQVYTASGAALLASAVVAISNVTQTSSLPVVAPPAQIPPGPAPVQYLLKENLVRLLLTPLLVRLPHLSSSSFTTLEADRAPSAKPVSSCVVPARQESGLPACDRCRKGKTRRV